MNKPTHDITPEISGIISEIAKINFSADGKKWRVCEMISDAYSEFPAYKRGLTVGLAIQLNKSPQHIHDMRVAWEVKSQLNLINNNLRFSFFAKIDNLNKRYALTKEEMIYFLTEASTEGWSVKTMSQEIERTFDEDPDAKIMRRFSRVAKELRLCWQEAEIVHMPDPIRKPLYTLLQLLEDWLGL